MGLTESVPEAEIEELPPGARGGQRERRQDHAQLHHRPAIHHRRTGTAKPAAAAATTTTTAKQAGLTLPLIRGWIIGDVQTGKRSLLYRLRGEDPFCNKASTTNSISTRMTCSQEGGNNSDNDTMAYIPWQPLQNQNSQQRQQSNNSISKNTNITVTVQIQIIPTASIKDITSSSTESLLSIPHFILCLIDPRRLETLTFIDSFINDFFTSVLETTSFKQTTDADAAADVDAVADTVKDADADMVEQELELFLQQPPVMGVLVNFRDIFSIDENSDDLDDVDDNDGKSKNDDREDNNNNSNSKNIKNNKSMSFSTDTSNSRNGVESQEEEGTLECKQTDENDTIANNLVQGNNVPLLEMSRIEEVIQRVILRYERAIIDGNNKKKQRDANHNNEKAKKHGEDIVPAVTNNSLPPSPSTATTLSSILSARTLYQIFYTSMKDCYGLDVLHSFFNIPYVALRKTLLLRKFLQLAHEKNIMTNSVTAMVNKNTSCTGYRNFCDLVLRSNMSGSSSSSGVGNGNDGECNDANGIENEEVSVQSASGSGRQWKEWDKDGTKNKASNQAINIDQRTEEQRKHQRVAIDQSQPKGERNDNVSIRCHPVASNQRHEILLSQIPQQQQQQLHHMLELNHSAHEDKTIFRDLARNDARDNLQWKDSAQLPEEKNIRDEFPKAMNSSKAVPKNALDSFFDDDYNDSHDEDVCVHNNHHGNQASVESRWDLGKSPPSSSIDQALVNIGRSKGHESRAKKKPGVFFHCSDSDDDDYYYDQTGSRRRLAGDGKEIPSAQSSRGSSVERTRVYNAQLPLHTNSTRALEKAELNFDNHPDQNKTLPPMQVGKASQINVSDSERSIRQSMILHSRSSAIIYSKEANDGQSVSAKKSNTAFKVSPPNELSPNIIERAKLRSIDSLSGISSPNNDSQHSSKLYDYARSPSPKVTHLAPKSSEKKNEMGQISEKVLLNKDISSYSNDAGVEKRIVGRDGNENNTTSQNESPVNNFIDRACDDDSVDSDNLLIWDNDKALVWDKSQAVPKKGTLSPVSPKMSSSPMSMAALAAIAAAEEEARRAMEAALVTNIELLTTKHEKASKPKKKENKKRQNVKARKKEKNIRKCRAADIT